MGIEKIWSKNIFFVMKLLENEVGNLEQWKEKL